MHSDRVTTLNSENIYINGGCKIGNWQAQVQCIDAIEDVSGNLENIRDTMVVWYLSKNDEKAFRDLLDNFSDIFSRIDGTAIKFHIV